MKINGSNGENMKAAESGGSQLAWRNESNVKYNIQPGGVVVSYQSK
jgi:hypothetical protein